jgi:hypothetical protein
MNFNNSFPRRPLLQVGWEIKRWVYDLACQLWILGVVILRPVRPLSRHWFMISVALLAYVGVQQKGVTWEDVRGAMPKVSFFQSEATSIGSKAPKPVQASFLTSLASIAPQPTLADTTVIALWGQVRSEGLADGWAGVRDDQAFYMALMSGAENKDDIVAFARNRNRKAIWKGLAEYRKSFPGGDPIKPLLADGKK